LRKSYFAVAAKPGYDCVSMVMLQGWGDRWWEGSVKRNCEPMDKNRIEGAAEQGERASDCEALVIKAKWRKFGGCAGKECVLTWGDLASWLKGRR
jgi:hypothetical protein